MKNRQEVEESVGIFLPIGHTSNKTAAAPAVEKWKLLNQLQRARALG
jgi:hypothetical protein